MSFWSEAIGKWELSRNGVVGELRVLNPSHLDVKPAEGARSAREIAVHLMESAVGFTAAFEQGVSWAQPPSLEYGTASATELADAMLAQWVELKPRLEALAAGEEAMRDGFFGPRTQLTNLWFAVAHEWYHQGQLATYVRLSGEVPALTRMIGGAAKDAPASPAG